MNETLFGSDETGPVREVETELGRFQWINEGGDFSAGFGNYSDAVREFADRIEAGSPSILRGMQQTVHWNRYRDTDYAYTAESRLAAAKELMDAGKFGHCAVAAAFIDETEEVMAE